MSDNGISFIITLAVVLIPLTIALIIEARRDKRNK